MLKKTEKDKDRERASGKKVRKSEKERDRQQERGEKQTDKTNLPNLGD